MIYADYDLLKISGPPDFALNPKIPFLRKSIARLKGRGPVQSFYPGTQIPTNGSSYQTFRFRSESIGYFATVHYSLIHRPLLITSA